jgi:hypothetical protein
MAELRDLPEADRLDRGPMPESSPAETFRPGDRLGPYTLLCPLAAGGMGNVWSAAFRGAQGFSKFVAIKTLLHELADEVQYARALRDEAQPWSSLSASGRSLSSAMVAQQRDR